MIYHPKSKGKGIEVFARDVSKSNPAAYLIQNPHNYLAIKKGMVFGQIGLLPGLFEIWITQVPSINQPEADSI